jgi:hypothetical protein
MRTVLVVVALGLLALAASSGCLFPSFDKFEGDVDADATKSDDAGSESAAETGGLEQFITCGDRTCAVGFQFCCLGATTAVGCFGADKATECSSAAERRLRCDGAEDCPSGQVCCEDPGTAEVGCRPSCAGGTALCTGSTRCPAGQTCSADDPPRGLGLKACKAGP